MPFRRFSCWLRFTINRNGTAGAVSAKRCCRGTSAFTLIELLVVVGILSILATIALPNFLQAQTRAKVSRVKSDMRTLATALETYAALNNKYPRRHNFTSDPASHLETFNDSPYIVPPSKTKMQDLSVLTTPVPFLTSLPIDVFDMKTPYPNNIIDYYDSIQAQRLFNRKYLATKYLTEEAKRQGLWANHGWMLVSVGPDGYINWYQPNASKWDYPVPPADAALRFTFHFMYDERWGTVSQGNIYRFQNDPEPEKKSNHLDFYNNGTFILPSP